MMTFLIGVCVLALMGLLAWAIIASIGLQRRATVAIEQSCAEVSRELRRDERL